MNKVKPSFKFSSLFYFGRDIDAEATKIKGEAEQRHRTVATALESYKDKAKSMLDEIDEMRTKLYRDSLAVFFDHYDPAFSGLKNIPPETGQARQFTEAAPSFSASTKVGTPFSLGAKGALIVLFGSVWWVALSLFGEFIGFQSPAISIASGGALLGVLSAMTFCYRRAHKNLVAATDYSGNVRDFEASALQFGSKVEQLAKDYPLATEALERKAFELNRQVHSLTEIVQDAVNAAMLLKDLIGKPLLDGEGALLADVMQQLEDDVARAAEMQKLLGLEDLALLDSETA